MCWVFDVTLQKWTSFPQFEKIYQRSCLAKFAKVSLKLPRVGDQRQAAYGPGNSVDEIDNRSFFNESARFVPKSLKVVEVRAFWHLISTARWPIHHVGTLALEAVITNRLTLPLREGVAITKDMRVSAFNENCYRNFRRSGCGWRRLRDVACDITNRSD